MTNPPAGFHYDFESVFNYPDPPVEEVVEPQSFRNSLIRVLCYTAVVPIFMLGLFQSQQFQKAMQTADQAQLAMAQNVTVNADINCTAARRLLTVLVDTLTHNDPEEVTDILYRAVSHSVDTLASVVLYDRQGEEIARVDRQRRVPSDKTREAMRLIAREVSNVPEMRVLRRAADGAPALAIGVRSMEEAESGLTSAVALLDLSFLSEAVNRIVSGGAFDAVVVDRDQTVLYDLRHDAAAAANMALEGLQDEEAAIAASPKGLLVRTPGTRDVSQIKTYARSETLGWTVAVSQPLKERDRILMASIETSSFFFLGTVFLTLLVASVMNRPLTRSVNALMDAVEAFGRTGRFEPMTEKLEKDGISEMVELGAAFERMVDQVSEGKRKLERMNMKLEEEVAERTYTLLARNSELRAIQTLLLPMQVTTADRATAVREHVAGSVAQFSSLLGLSKLTFVPIRPGEKAMARSVTPVAVELSGKTYGWLAAGPDDVMTPDRVDSIRRLANSLAIVLANEKLVDQLAREHETLTNIFESMTDGVVLIGRSGRIIYANDFARILLNDGASLVGLYREDIEKRYGQTLPVKSTTTRTRLVRRTAKAQTQTLDVVSFIVTDLPGMPGERQGWLIRDISREAGIDAMKENLVSVVAHELKTPVTALRLLAENLTHDAETRTASDPRNVRELLDETLRLGQLIDDLLDVSRIEGGAMKLEKRVMQIASVIDRASRLARTRYPIEIVRKIDPEAEVILADPARLTQVFINLFVNAARYRKPEQGVARCTVSVRPGQGGTVVIDVTDEGTGMRPEQMARIFEPFYQIDMTTSRAGGGAGLGLTIVKGIVEAHHGEVKVASVFGDSTTFTVTLPA